MEGDRHFSHHHPLLDYEEEDEYGTGDFKYHSCRICGLPILSSPSYTCNTSSCEFFLHKSCAIRFLEIFIHPSHGPLDGNDHDHHPLYLEQRSPNFIYKCKACNFEMHPLVAAIPPVEIKTNHKSHPSHPLVAICKEISSTCDACGEKQCGFFFACGDCNFLIHQECTMLPSIVMLVPHPLLDPHPLPFLLAYSFPVKTRNTLCIVCHDKLLLNHNAIYFCPNKADFAHASCAKDRIIQPGTRLELIQLPDHELDTFPSLEMRGYSQWQKNRLDDDDDEKLTIEKLHNHPLILEEEEEEKGIIGPYNKLVCDICTQTINNTPFYRCSQGSCYLLAHKVCADVLPIIEFVIPDLQFCLADPTRWFFNAIFYCIICRLPCNGPCYYLPSTKIFIRDDDDDDFRCTVDVLCMAAPVIIKHTSHNQHLLYRTLRFSRDSHISCCSGGSTYMDVYKCSVCNFYIHIRCAFLPKRISHEFDQHPLHLITTSDSDENDFCEVCEECIDHKYWFYHCATCDYSFHINCIPSLGYLSKVKFGGKHSISSHSHPLTLTRMLDVGRNERCGHCHDIIQGLVDQVAFCCSEEDCGFWIHFHCARDSCASEARVFGEIDEQVLCNKMIDSFEC